MRPQTKSSTKPKDKELNVWDWLIKGTGSVEEPWPTVEKVLQDPEVKADIKTVKEAFDEYKKNLNLKQPG